MIAGCEMREAIVGAVCDFGGTLDEDVLLKWPNDIFAGGKKLGGVLAEMVPIPDCGDRVAIVIGVGLNLAVAQERLPIDKSTSLQLVARNLLMRWCCAMRLPYVGCKDCARGWLISKRTLTVRLCAPGKR